MQFLIPLLLALGPGVSDTTVVPLQEIVVSATRTPRDATSIPNATALITGAELRRRGTRTLAEALQDIVGIDTGNGSDNGSRLPNIGLWGLKEFDALLVTLDGVPIGGPFNPSLSHIPVEDIDRIEIVKGPQGTLYGVSAFAGMIQVFSRMAESGTGHVTLGGGSFGDGHGSGGIEHRFEEGTRARLSAALARSDGWQDRTKSEIDRGGLGLSRSFGRATLDFLANAYRDKQDWGTPLPFDAGVSLPGFDSDRNYAVRGAIVEHKVYEASSQLTWPLTDALRLENTLAFSHDRQNSVRSFVGAVNGDTVVSAGVAIQPTEKAVYEDLHFVSKFDRGGEHEAVAGAALTWGRTRASGIGFDFDQFLSAYPTIPDVNDIPVGDHRSFNDRRTFAGVYLHDVWTPVPRLSISGGGRYDRASEKLSARGQEVGGPLEVSNDSRTDGAWSGDASVLFRAATEGMPLSVANFYVNYKSSFKPAAPNLTEAESATILKPERTHSVEGGVKTQAFDRTVSVNLSAFRMDFKNLVVSTLGSGGLPVLVNAGRERFKGVEMDLRWAPRFVPHAALAGGYGYHDARFVDFTFVTPDGALRDVRGKKLELVPRELANVSLSYAPAEGIGGFVAARYQGKRPLNRRNTFFTDTYTEWDAGLSYDFGAARLVVSGRNLGDDRHVVTESEIGDSQFYISAPRRVTVELTGNF